LQGLGGSISESQNITTNPSKNKQQNFQNVQVKKTENEFSRKEATRSFRYGWQTRAVSTEVEHIHTREEYTQKCSPRLPKDTHFPGMFRAELSCSAKLETVGAPAANTTDALWQSCYPVKQYCPELSQQYG
jgi:hypothetical protein